MAVALVALAVGACGGTERSGDDAEEAPSEAAAESGDASTGALPYVSEVVSFTPGSGAGFGQESMPEVVLGPPAPGPPTAGSLDVLSLGDGGEIVLSFGDRAIVDGPGPDLVVFENPFWVSGDPDNPFAELGAVAVSLDGEQWHEFPCDTELEEGFDTGCAGWRPRLQYDSRDLVPLDPGLCGGDPFDLADDVFQILFWNPPVVRPILVASQKPVLFPPDVVEV